VIRAVGIDLSLTATAVARDDGICALFGQQGVTNLSIVEQADLFTKLAFEIRNQAVGVTGTMPALVAIEALDMARSYGGQIERTVLWWSVVGLLHKDGVEVLVVPSAILKTFATGKSSARKSEVVDAVARRWPQFETGGDDNKADAAVLCAIARHRLGIPLGHLPVTHVRRLESARLITEPPPKSSLKKKPAAPV